MNIAIPGILIILGILPGIIFFNTYFSGKFARRFTKITPLIELSWYVLLALFINILFVWHFPEFIGKIKFELIALATKGSLQSIPGNELEKHINDWSRIFVYSIFQLFLFSSLLGLFFKRLVWVFRLDLYIPFLKMKCEWYYSLLGRQKNLKPWFTIVYADILTTLSKEETILYRGVVEDFEVSGDNIEISNITLINAQRGNGLRGDEFVWKNITGDKIVLFSSSIHSINLTYIPVEVKLDICDGITLYLSSFLLGK